MISMRQHLRRIAFGISCLMGLSNTPALATEGRLTLPETGDATIAITLKDPLTTIEPTDVLQVFVGASAACCDGRSPVAGRYTVSGRTVSFDPAFGLVEGQIYTVMIRDQNARDLTEFTIHPKATAVPAQVLAIHPGGDSIPENTLRFYIHFSTPMQPHRSTDFIKLVDETGTADTAAFMTFKQELWNDDRTRLTLLMDPGRIKRGVATNLALGPALLEGKSYSIVVEDGWPSANGKDVTSRFEKAFLVGPALRSLPATENWRVNAPAAHSRAPLVIAFDRPFDHHLLQSGIGVLDGAGQPVPGSLSVESHGLSWRFVPRDDWTSGTLNITVDARLEDVAGNNFRDLLDHAVDTEIQSPDQRVITLELKTASD